MVLIQENSPCCVIVILYLFVIISHRVRIVMVFILPKRGSTSKQSFLEYDQVTAELKASIVLTLLCLMTYLQRGIAICEVFELLRLSQSILFFYSTLTACEI